MSLAADCAWTLGRGAVVGVAGVLIAGPMRAVLARRGGWRSRAGWALLLMPYLAPALLVAYGYRGLMLRLELQPGLRELAYTLVLWLRLAPVAALARHFAPAALSAEALHCHRLLRGGSRPGRSAWSSLAMLAHGPLRGWAVGFGAVFLLAFGEFEMASLFQVRAWTVTLFDAHAGGLALGESLRLAALPAACEAALLLVVLGLLLGGLHLPKAGAIPRPPAAGAWAMRVGTVHIAGAAMVVVGVPLWTVLGGTVRALGGDMSGVWMWKDMGASVLFGAGAAACAYLVAGGLGPLSCERRGPGKGPAPPYLLAAVAACMPGLLGALVLSLVIVAAFQLPGLRALYDSPVPLVVCLTLLLLPVALLLRFLLHALRPGESVHAARLLYSAPSGGATAARVRRAGARLVREIENRGRFWVLFLLFCWGYFDLIASSNLAPGGTNPVFVLLYNQMHYGQMEMLSARVFIAFCAPIILLLAAGGARRASPLGASALGAAHG